KTSEEIIALFKALHAQGQTIVIVTHEEDVARHAERIVRLRDGKVFSDFPTRQDPIHTEYLRTMVSHAMNVAKSEGVEVPMPGGGVGKGVTEVKPASGAYANGHEPAVAQPVGRGGGGA